MGPLRNKIAKIERAERDQAAMEALQRALSPAKTSAEAQQSPPAPPAPETARTYVPNERARLKWVRVYCVSPFCNHSRAMPLAPWRIRWGVEDPCPLMRRHFRCGVCGRWGCVFYAPRETIQGVIETWDPEFFPAGRELHMAGPRETGESSQDRNQRVLAAYLARYPNGDAIKTVDAMCNLYSITKGPAAIRELAKAMRDLTGNFEPLTSTEPAHALLYFTVQPEDGDG